MKYILIILFFLSACATSDRNGQKIVLVHGSHFDERVFTGLKRYFKDRAVAVELPTTTQLGNTEDYYRTLSLAKYAAAVCEKLEGLSEKAILLGHGLGGAVINQAYGQCPEAIAKLIFLGATVPHPGETPFQLFTAQDFEHYLKAVTESDETTLYEIVDRYVFVDAFAPDASQEDRELIANISRAEPIAPTRTSVKFDLNSWQRLKKLMIITTADKIISPETQKKFTIRMKNTTIREIDSGHLPMITDIDALGDMISEFAAN
jgi:pimeloyl-ACP methyl ester carboxylesterase